MSDVLELSVSYRSVKFSSWKSAIMMLLPFPICINKTRTRIKANEDQDFSFCGSSKTSPLEYLENGAECFNFFLNFFSLEVFFLVRLCCLFTWLLNSWKAYRVRCKSVVAKTRRTSKSAACCSLNVSSIARRSSLI